MFAGQKVAVIIPALNEAEAIGEVIGQIDRELADWVVVGDNGSEDATAEIAAAAGALVMREERRGYGSACLKAITAVPEADILVFLDADGGDDPRELALLLQATGDVNEVGERVHFVHQATVFIPLATHFLAAPDVCDHVNESTIHQADDRTPKTGVG